MKEDIIIFEKNEKKYIKRPLHRLSFPKFQKLIKGKKQLEEEDDYLKVENA